MRKPKRLTIFGAMHKAARGQKRFYGAKTWDTVALPGEIGQRARDKQRGARAAVILGNALTLGIWHLPMMAIGAGKLLHKRNRARRQFEENARATEQRQEYIRTVENTFRGMTRDLQDGFEFSVPEAQLCSEFMLYRLGLGNVPASNRIFDAGFRSKYDRLEAHMREQNPGVNYLFEELGIE